MSQDPKPENTAQPTSPALSPDVAAQNETAQSIKALSEALLGETENLRRLVDKAQGKELVNQLKNSVELFRAMSDAALVSAQTHPLPQTQAQAAAAVAPAPAKGCGCHGAPTGCGPTTKPTCCVELYISMVEVVVGQSLPEVADMDELELMVAVQADGQSWGLAPGLNSTLNASKKGGPVALNAPIGRFCVPCEGCRTVTLTAQAHEVEENVAGMRAEYGSKAGLITLNCNCLPAPTQLTVYMDGGGATGGVVAIYVSARFIAGSCCGY